MLSLADKVQYSKLLPRPTNLAVQGEKSGKCVDRHDWQVMATESLGLVES
jgi:hypothetical protein